MLAARRQFVKPATLDNRWTVPSRGLRPRNPPRCHGDVKRSLDFTGAYRGRWIPESSFCGLLASASKPIIIIFSEDIEHESARTFIVSIVNGIAIDAFSNFGGEAYRGRGIRGKSRKALGLHAQQTRLQCQPLMSPGASSEWRFLLTVRLGPRLES